MINKDPLSLPVGRFGGWDPPSLPPSLKLWRPKKAVEDESGKRGSNSRPSAWEADALPTELFPHKIVQKHG